MELDVAVFADAARRTMGVQLGWRRTGAGHLEQAQRRGADFALSQTPRLPHEWTWGSRRYCGQSGLRPRDDTDLLLPAPARSSRSCSMLNVFEVPKAVLFTDAMPRTAAGKIQKNVLRERHRSHFES